MEKQNFRKKINKLKKIYTYILFYFKATVKEIDKLLTTDVMLLTFS